MSQRRAREDRTPVAIKARLKSEIGWGDSQVCNVSKRGMMVRHVPPPPLGSYVEVCKGPFSIVGRVRWIANDRFGMQALETIDLATLENPQRIRPGPISDRRRRARPTLPQTTQLFELTDRLASSQRLARRLRFAVIGLAGTTMALLAAHVAASTLAAPVERVATVLALAR